MLQSPLTHPEWFHCFKPLQTYACIWQWWVTQQTGWFVPQNVHLTAAYLTQHHMQIDWMICSCSLLPHTMSTLHGTLKIRMQCNAPDVVHSFAHKMRLRMQSWCAIPKCRTHTTNKIERTDYCQLTTPKCSSFKFGVECFTRMSDYNFFACEDNKKIGEG